MSVRLVTRPNAGARLTALGTLFLASAGCTPQPTFKDLRLAGQQQVLEHNMGAARRLFEDAHQLVPEDAYNLHDLGVCSMVLARERFRERNYPAAMREVDQAIAYYSRSVNAHPGFQAALEGKNRALELKGQFEKALQEAEWAREFVGPSARQQIFLARELEERGDFDGAWLRYRQAVVMEPNNPTAQGELGKFLHRQNRDDEAVVYLQEAYRLNPNEPGVLSALVEMGAQVPYTAPK